MLKSLVATGDHNLPVFLPLTCTQNLWAIGLPLFGYKADVSILFIVALVALAPGFIVVFCF